MVWLETVSENDLFKTGGNMEWYFFRASKMVMLSEA
jgi:hypothetical protein